MKDRIKKEVDIVNGPLLSSICQYAYPLMLTNFAQQLFTAIDTVIIGNFAGDNAMAAVGATGSLIFLFTSLFNGLSMGATVVAAQLIGEGNQESVRKSVHTSYGLGFYCGIVMAVLGLCGSKFFLSLMKTPADIIDSSALYMRIYFLSSIFLLVYNFGAAILRAKGDTRRPLYALAASGIVKAAGSLFMVSVMKMGVAGVACATIVSQLVAAIIVTIALVNEEGAIHLDLRSVSIDGTIALNIMKIGIPAGIQSMMYSISNVVLQSSLNSFDSANVIAGNSAGGNIENFAYIGMYSFSQACVTFTSQNYGARKYDKLKKIMYLTLALCVASAFSISFVMWLFRYPLLDIFTDEPAIMEVGALRITYVVLPLFLNGVLDIFVGSMRGMGKSTLATILMMAGICGVRLAWLLIYFKINPQLYIVYLSFPLSWLVTSVIEYILWLIVYRQIINQQN